MRLVSAAGIFVLTAALYCIASPGQIDIIDGQYRFDVAKNLVTLGPGSFAIGISE